MTAFSTYFNGVDLSQWIHITDVERDVGMNSKANMETIGTADGQAFRYTSAAAGSISVSYVMLDKSNQKRRELGGLLHVSEPKQLIFSDEPEKYYLAIPEGQATLEEKFRHGNGTITFTVPDDVAYNIIPAISTNQPTGVAGENLFPDSEFAHPKYWKTWVGFVDGYGGSSGAAAEFNPAAGDDDPDYIQAGELISSGYYRLTKPFITRRKVGVKVGDIINASIMVKVDKADGNVFVLNVSESATKTSATTTFDAVNAKAVAVGTWTKLTVSHTVQSADTQFLELKPYVIGTSQVMISQPMMSIGATPINYVASGADLLDTIDVVNSGTYQSWPIIHALMNSDNSLVAFASSNGGALRFGDPDDVDAVAIPHIDREYHWDMTKKPTDGAVNKGQMLYTERLNNPKTPNRMYGSWKFGQYGGNVAYPVYDDTGYVDQTWDGPSMHKTLAGNYEGSKTADIEFVNRYPIDTWTTSMFRVETTLESASGPYMTVTFRSSTISTNDFYMDIMLNGKTQRSFNLNPLVAYYNKTDKQWHKKGTVELRLRRRGDVFTVVVALIQFTDGKMGYVPGKRWTYSYTIADYGLTPVTGTTVWVTGYGKYYADIQWADSYFEWVNAEGDIDIPNEFSQGQELTIDTAARKVYLDGAETGLYTVGNQWDLFAVPPQDNLTLMPVASSYASPMTVWVELQEAFV